MKSFPYVRIPDINFRETFRLIWSLGSGKVILSALFITLESLCWLGTIYTLKILIDELVQNKDSGYQQILNYIILAGTTSVLYALIKNISAFLNEKQSAEANHLLDRKIHEQVLKLDLVHYDNPHYLNILKRAKEAAIDRPYAIVFSLLEIAKNGLMLLTISYILLSIDWLLLPLLALFVLPLLYIRIRFSRKIYQWQRSHTELERQAGYLSHLITSDTAAKEVRAFSLGNYFLPKYSSIKQRLLDKQNGLNWKRTIAELVTGIFGAVALFAVIAYIILGTFKGTTSVGDIAVFLVVFQQSFVVMQTLAGSLTKFYQNSIYLKDVFELFALNSVLFEPEQPVPIPAVNADLRIENISFKYPHSDEIVLEDISIVVPVGKIVALVGLNGAGKSTLVKLVSRLYDPIAGQIKLGNIDIRRFDLKSYRKCVTTVFQDFVCYNVSVADNIHFGDITAEKREADIRVAAIQSGAQQYVGNFPEEYETILGKTFEGGREISIGQWQMLAVARALYSKANLLVMDEATSAMDVTAEATLFQSIRNGAAGKSILIISHRTSAIMQADYIYVMADKRIVESGTHENLMALNGRYAKLFATSIEQYSNNLPNLNPPISII